MLLTNSVEGLRLLRASRKAEAALSKNSPTAPASNVPAKAPQLRQRVRGGCAQFCPACDYP